MSYDIVNQVEKLFENREQWDSFLDIANQRNLICETWVKKFISAIHKTVKPVQNWSYSANTMYDHRWYINDLGVNSFCLVAGYVSPRSKFSLGLWAPPNKYDIKKLSELLQEEEFGEPIKAKFDQLDYIGNDTTEWKFAENFIFNGPGESEEMDFDRMVWFANYKTAEFVSQLVAKVKKFQEDDEITKILLKLNNGCLKE